MNVTCCVQHTHCSSPWPSPRKSTCMHTCTTSSFRKDALMIFNAFICITLAVAPLTRA